MEEQIYKIEVISKIRKAISSSYSDVTEVATYHECMELLNDVEEEVIKELKQQ
jgi:hypothetical protein